MLRKTTSEMTEGELVEIIRRYENPDVPTSQYSKALNELKLRDREKSNNRLLGVKNDIRKIQPTINKIKRIMVDVATGQERIENCNEAYRKLYGKINMFCLNNNIKNPNPYSDLWEFYSFWSEKIRTYSDRRVYIVKLYKNFGNNLRKRNNASISLYIDRQRLKELKSINSSKFDLSKLIKMCEEINCCYTNNCNLAVIVLLRSVLNHVPPIFGFTDFDQVSAGYGKKSFKALANKLNESSRKIADSYLHDPIRKKETLPNRTQVNFSQELDFLLAEIISLLS